MHSKLFSCCSEHVPQWIFVYENGEAYTICKTYFKSDPHRLFVKYVINIKNSELLDPEDIFVTVEAPNV